MMNDKQQIAKVFIEIIESKHEKNEQDREKLGRRYSAGKYIRWD